MYNFRCSFQFINILPQFLAHIFSESSDFIVDDYKQLTKASIDVVAPQKRENSSYSTMEKWKV